MSYNFKPMSDEELDAINLVPDGIYNFEVVKSTRKVSKSGNPMAELQLTIWDKEGRTHLIFDYLVFSDVNLNIKKVSHFSKAVGLHDEYLKGCLPEELERYSGTAEIGIQEEQPKPTGGFYARKNYVKEYLAKDKEKASTKKEEPFFDDDVPF